MSQGNECKNVIHMMLKILKYKIFPAFVFRPFPRFLPVAMFFLPKKCVFLKKPNYVTIRNCLVNLHMDVFVVPFPVCCFLLCTLYNFSTKLFCHVWQYLATKFVQAGNLMGQSSNDHPTHRLTSIVRNIFPAFGFAPFCLCFFIYCSRFFTLIF